jgi:hypothetical protein
LEPWMCNFLCVALEALCGMMSWWHLFAKNLMRGTNHLGEKGMDRRFLSLFRMSTLVISFILVAAVFHLVMLFLVQFPRIQWCHSWFSLCVYMFMTLGLMLTQLATASHPSAHQAQRRKTLSRQRLSTFCMNVDWSTLLISLGLVQTSLWFRRWIPNNWNRSPRRFWEWT